MLFLAISLASVAILPGRTSRKTDSPDSRLVDSGLVVVIVKRKSSGIATVVFLINGFLKSLPRPGFWVPSLSRDRSRRWSCGAMRPKYRGSGRKGLTADKSHDNIDNKGTIREGL